MLAHKLMGTVIATAAVTAGVVMRGVLLLIGSPFTESLIVATTAAVITGVFSLLVVLVQARLNREIHLRLDVIEERARDTAKALGAAQRDADQRGANDVGV